MRARTTSVLVAALLGAVPALAFADCDPEDARAVVDYARKRGYRFEVARSSADGTCWIDTLGYLLFASATTTNDVVCDARIFSKAVNPAAVSPAPAGAAVADTPAAESAAATTPAWAIVAIRIATSDGGSIFPTEDKSDPQRGWTFRITAARGGTSQYRIDTVEFRAQEECMQWRNAF